MSNLVDEFKKTLEKKDDDKTKLETAIILLEVCREYIDRHYKKAVFGKYQKNLVDVIDEFLKGLE